jgi:CTP synthase (UTP-ammonia lyase)
LFESETQIKQFIESVGVIIQRNLEIVETDGTLGDSYGELTLSAVKDLLRNLKDSISNLQLHKLFPYNPNALIRLLDQTIQSISPHA